jgi:hypothetical protein
MGSNRLRELLAGSFERHLVHAQHAFRRVIVRLESFAPIVEAKPQPQSEFIPLDIPQSGDCDLDLIIFHAGERAGVDPRFIHAVIQQESRYKPDATSGVGAKGLMQLMPDTGKRFHCTDLNDQKCNVEAGTKYLRWLLKIQWRCSLTLAAYNAGETVDKYKGIPPYHETENYVKKIVGNYGKTTQSFRLKMQRLNST